MTRPKRKPRPTDTARLTWLLRELGAGDSAPMVWLDYHGWTRMRDRRDIDRAMRAERKGKHDR